MTKYFIVSTFFLFAFAIIIDIFIRFNNLLTFGKDNGLIARVILTILGSIIFYIVIQNKLTFKNIIIGVSLGVLAYLILFLLYFLLSTIIYMDNRGFDLPLLVDQLIATTIVVIIVKVRLKRAK